MTTIELEAPRAVPNSLAPLHDGVAAPNAPKPSHASLVARGVAAARSYYGTELARLRLVATAMTLLYVGGAAMFWLHAIHRGEAGPPIAHPWHWLLDSTLGLVGLGPALLVLLPLARRVTARRDWSEPLVVGGLFALMTTPGPLLHNLIAGRGTPLARMATSVFGTDPAVAASHAHAVEHSMVGEAFLQLAFGLPVYATLASAVWWAVRRRAGATRGASQPDRWVRKGDAAMG